jgi:hypothetical protein
MFNLFFNTQNFIFSANNNFFVINLILIYVWISLFCNRDQLFSSKIFLLKFYFVCLTTH